MSGRLDPLRQPAVRFILGVAMLDVMAMGLCIPVLPGLMRELVGNDMQRTSSFLGLFVTLWALAQFALSPLIGAWSDQVGRRPVLLLSCISSCLGFAIMAWAPSLAWLVFARVVSAAASATISVVNAYIADTQAPEQRPACFSLVASACGLGFVLGPAIGGALGDIDVRLPFWVAAAMTLLNAAYGSLVLSESLPPERRTAFSWRRANPVGSMLLLSSRPSLAWIASANFLLMLAELVLPSTFVVYVMYRYGWSASTIGYTLMVVGVSGVLAQVLLFKPTVERLGERRALVVCLLTGVLGMSFYGLASSAMWLWLSIPLLSLYGLSAPIFGSLLTRQVDASTQGQLQGAMASLTGISGMLGPAIFSQTFNYFIQPSNPWMLPGAPFFLAALLLLLAARLAWRATRPAPAPTLAPTTPSP